MKEKSYDYKCVCGNIVLGITENKQTCSECDREMTIVKIRKINKQAVDYCGICGKPLYSYKRGGICKDKTCEEEWKKENRKIKAR